ncbi:zf-HC2 domain-containing protein [candidate division WOR-3 bacterium]|nr:zf-HC2 domain-containing protein [candidate division WOR-3 bacterium]
MRHINKKRLSAYLDGELNENLRQEIKIHLEVCKYCQGLVAELKTVSQSLEILEDLDPTPFFSKRVRSKVLEKTQVRGWRKVMVPALASTAAALSIILGGFISQEMLGDSSGTDTGTETELASYLGTSPVQDFPEGSLGDVIDEVFPDEGAAAENGGNS